MAILAMSFDLMQEELVAKFTWVGKKLSIITDIEIYEEEDLSLEKVNQAINNMKMVQLFPNKLNIMNVECEEYESKSHLYIETKCDSYKEASTLVNRLN